MASRNKAVQHPSSAMLRFAVQRKENPVGVKKSSRGFDRKGHTMRNPPAQDEARNPYTEEFYDLMSITNVESTGVDSEQDFDNKRRIMRGCIMRLGDAAIPAQSRVDAFDILALLLMNARSKEMLSNLNEELFNNTVRTFTRNTAHPGEIFKGMRVLGLLTLHEGLHNDGYVRKLLQYLGNLPERFDAEGSQPINYTNRFSGRAIPPPAPYTAESVRCEAMATIALAIFFCADDEELIERGLDIVETMLCRQKGATGVTEDGAQGVEEVGAQITDSMRGAAADSWCLIAMRLDATKILSRAQNRVIHAFRNMLFSDDLDTRVAAGEAIAFLHELAVETSESDESPELWISPDRDIWDDIIEELDFLSGEYDRRLSRRERREQHKMFRAFHQALTENHYPLEVLKLPDSQLTVESWAGVKVLDMLRHFMGRGFHEGLYHFQSVQDVLGMPDWMRKIVRRDRVIEDDELDERQALGRRPLVEDGSSLPSARASRRFQSRTKKNRHRTTFADDMFPREYDVPHLPTAEGTSETTNEYYSSA